MYWQIFLIVILLSGITVYIWKSLSSEDEFDYSIFDEDTDSFSARKMHENLDFEKVNKSFNKLLDIIHKDKSCYMSYSTQIEKVNYIYYNVMCILSNIKNTDNDKRSAIIAIICCDILGRLFYNAGLFKYNKRKGVFKINPTMKNQFADVPENIDKKNIESVLPFLRKNIISKMDHVDYSACGNECLPMADVVLK